MQSFNRAQCEGAIFTDATLNYITIQEMDFLHRVYGDVLEIEAGDNTLLGDYEKGAECEGNSAVSTNNKTV